MFSLAPKPIERDDANPAFEQLLDCGVQYGAEDCVTDECEA
jgi:hypothetical protein